MEFKDQFEEEKKLLLAMEEINKRREEQKIYEKEWFSVWMLGRVNMRKRMEDFQFKALRDIVKEGGDNVMKNFGDK